jgi:hypothetical protein
MGISAVYVCNELYKQHPMEPYRKKDRAEVLRRRAAASGTQHSHARPPTGMRSSPLAVLPPELLCHILDFMAPEEYSGLSCTCQDMLSIANQKLATPNDSHFTFIRDYWSRTGASIATKHRMDKITQEYHDMLAELDRQNRERWERVRQMA